MVSNAIGRNGTGINAIKLKILKLNKMAQQTTFKTTEETANINIKIACTGFENEKFTIELPATDLLVKDTICWTGYYVSNFAVQKRLPKNVYSFHIEGY